jgi:hypothetical protein
LHVLSTPPAFVLSQDQTLRECLEEDTRRAAQLGGITQAMPTSSLCSKKSPPHQPPTTGKARGINISGVDF